MTLNAREADDAGGGVDEAADEEALGGGLARGILADLGVELVGAHHVAALGYNSVGFKPVPNNVGSFDRCLKGPCTNDVSLIFGIFDPPSCCQYF